MSTTPEHVPQPDAEDRDQGQGNGLAALVVLAPPTARQVLATALEELGFTRVVAVATAPDAAEPCGESPVDIVFIDAEAYGTLRDACPTLDGIPSVAVLPESRADGVFDALRAGAAHYLLIPFTCDDLQERLRRTLKDKWIPAI